MFWVRCQRQAGTLSDTRPCLLSLVHFVHLQLSDPGFARIFLARVWMDSNGKFSGSTECFVPAAWIAMPKFIAKTAKPRDPEVCCAASFQNARLSD